MNNSKKIIVKSHQGFERSDKTKCTNINEVYKRSTDVTKLQYYKNKIKNNSNEIINKKNSIE